VERAQAEAIYDQGREAVVGVLLEFSAQNERLTAQVEQLTARVLRQEERIAQLERRLSRSSRNSSQPPSADPPSAPRRTKDPSGRKQGAQPGHEGKGRPLLPLWAVDEVVEHWPTACGCGHVFCEADRGNPGGPGSVQKLAVPEPVAQAAIQAAQHASPGALPVQAAKANLVRQRVGRAHAAQYGGYCTDGQYPVDVINGGYWHTARARSSQSCFGVSSHDIITQIERDGLYRNGDSQQGGTEPASRPTRKSPATTRVAIGGRTTQTSMPTRRTSC
jgi:hypothetical protein